MRVIKDERTKPDGFIYCEHCGRPIVRAYDCIGHHTIELTEENVNDVEISLNADLIQLVHHKCHNKIHNKLGYSVRQVYIVYGPPFAGKTSFVSGLAEVGDLIIDMDDIWECISGCERYVKPGRLNAVAFKVRDELIRCVKYRVGKWNNAYIIGGYPLISERERMCKELGAREVFIDINKEECLDRLAVCEDGRNKEEWTRYINEWFRRYVPPL